MKEIKLNAKLSKIKTYARIKSIDFIINLKFTLGCYSVFCKNSVMYMHEMQSVNMVDTISVFLATSLRAKYTASYYI